MSTPPSLTQDTLEALLLLHAHALGIAKEGAFTSRHAAIILDMVSGREGRNTINTLTHVIRGSVPPEPIDPHEW